MLDSKHWSSLCKVRRAGYIAGLSWKHQHRRRGGGQCSEQKIVIADRAQLIFQTLNAERSQRERNLLHSDALSKTSGNVTANCRRRKKSKPVISWFVWKAEFRHNYSVSVSTISNRQDQHGLGLNDDGIDRIEIIKGPFQSCTEVKRWRRCLNIIDEKPAAIGRKEAEYNIASLATPSVSRWIMVWRHPMN